MIFPLPANNLYGNEPIPIVIPDDWDVTVCEYAGVNAPAMSYQEIQNAIAHPLGCEPISIAARGKKDAIIIIDDISRPTPVGEIAKAVIAELEEAGVPRDNIRFLAAIGTHRAMSREEFVRKLGEDIVQEFRCYSHNPFFNNVLLGHTSSGVPIELNAEAVSADFKIAVGNVVPHGVVGIAGGPKTILPGIASLETIKGLHSVGENRWDLTTPGQSIAAEGAKALGLDFKIDVMLNGQGEISVLYAGDVNQIIPAHEKEIQDFYRTPHVMDADIVIANNYFKPSEPFLSIAYNGIVFSVKKGGVLVVSSHSPQGAAPHYTLGKWGDSDVGGTLFKGLTPMARRLKTYYAFSTWLDKGTAVTYHFSGENMKWAGHWDEIMKDVGPEPKKLVIYPYASVGFYDINGNIAKLRK
ncbi:MAG: DUF2088 domain-containing protein [Lachnospiraceae bacterium]|nr:DUF2088 domain-containing protein [Lachnospiraceae bacterium]